MTKNRLRRRAAALLGAAMFAGAFSPSATAFEPGFFSRRAEGVKKTESGLQYEDVNVGTGVAPAAGQSCKVHYTGWLYKNGRKGKKFDSSVDRREPFSFKSGAGEVIKGWDEGVSTMKVGGKRMLIIPPELGSGRDGVGPIPPNATLLFEVELLGVR